jgi:hypothetical protein
VPEHDDTGKFGSMWREASGVNLEEVTNVGLEKTEVELLSNAGKNS